jgi:uridylate kinase
MMATVLNGLILKSYFEQNGVPSIIFSAIPGGKSTKDYSIRKAKEILGENKVVILTGGTGNPFFTTDSGAVLRALELDCDVVLKGTKVDGVFDSDPFKNPDAQKFDEITYEDAINKNLRVLDKTAFALALEKRIPLIVFDVFKKGNLKKVVEGEKIGTLVK